jgi:hypothetical protein
MSYSGTSWSSVGGTINSGFGGSYVSMAFSGSTPYVAYSDPNKSNQASVVSYNGTNWSNVGPAGFTSGPVTYTSMGVYNGNPIVAYADGGNSGYPAVSVYK